MRSWTRPRRERDLYDRQTVLFLDEIHRFTKAQQDALLPGVENRLVILVAATTENPSFSIIAPLLSRSVLVTLDVARRRRGRRPGDAAVADERGLGGRHALTEDALDAPRADRRRRRPAGAHRAGGGRGRRARRGGPPARHDGPVEITLAHVEQAVAQAAVRYDRAGDQHYDVASALIKSMRGSDVDAALHYLARMLEAGEDPRFIARRIVIAASEDVGMADPTALQTAVAAMHAVAQIGMPEARIILAQAVVHNAHGAQVQRRLPRHQRGDRRHAGRARAAPVPAAPARQRLRRGRAAGPRRRVRLRPRRARRGRRAAVPPGRPGRQRRTTTGRPTGGSRNASPCGSPGSRSGWRTADRNSRPRGGAAGQWPPWGSTPPPNAPSRRRVLDVRRGRVAPGGGCGTGS